MKPLILGVNDQPAHRDILTDALRRRFATDYDVRVAASPGEARRMLASAVADGRDVAVILAELWMAHETGTSFLAWAREQAPTARRVLTTEWGDFTSIQQIARASTLGDIDHATPRPWAATDEQFLAGMGEVIARWAHEQDRFVHAITIVGERWDAETQHLRDALLRWGAPVGFVDINSPEGQRRRSSLGADESLPFVVAPDGRVLPPRLAALAGASGGNDISLDEAFDVVVLGSGPAGLSAAVYGASEGLSVLLVESDSLGGQASSSPMIRNYLGFPGGIDGADLLGRAWAQAWRFGVRSMIGRSARAIRDEDGTRVVELDDGSQVQTRNVVLATGLAYRRLGVPSVESLVGRGVFYGSGATEAQALAGETVAVIGGANSAAEAAVHLARYASKVRMLVRGPSIAGSASDYLVEQLTKLPNVEILLGTEVVDARDAHRLRELVVHDRASGDRHTLDASALFILIGAQPRTDWLPPEIARTERGFVLSGADATSAPPGGSRFATSMPGVYAVGDVRQGSMKRIASAVGEGATAIREILTASAQVPSPRGAEREAVSA